MFRTWKLRRNLKKQCTYEYVYGKFDAYVRSHNGCIKSFTYYPEFFGCFTLIVTYKGVDYKFENDRGDIDFNDKFICNGSYHVPGEYSSVEKVIDLMGEIIFRQ